MSKTTTDLTSRWTGGPYYLTPEQRRWKRELFERGVKQEKEKKTMKREKMKAEIGELIEELDREIMRQEFYKRLWPKGKWENGFCSLCGEEAITEWNETGGEVIYTNFCPNCGAKMERREP